MTTSRAISWATAAILFAVAGCTPGDSLSVDDDLEPGSMIAQPIDMHSIRVQWGKVDGVASYRLERRTNLVGDFTAIAKDLAPNQTTYIDRNLEPATIYGYRVVTMDDFGKERGTSTIAGARTAPRPGIIVTMSSEAIGEAVDADGYVVTLRHGTDSEARPIEINGSELFGPLTAGSYQVLVNGLASQCEHQGDSVRTAEVTDQGLHTVDTLEYRINCRNPTRGRVKTTVTTFGDTVDADGYRVTLAGIADDASLPQSERAVVIDKAIDPSGGSASYDDVRPGNYTVRIDDVAPFCTVGGERQRPIRIDALADLKETFEVECNRPGGGGNGPFTFRTVWSRDTAASGAAVTLTAFADMTADASQALGAFELALGTTPGIVRIDSLVAGPGLSVSANIGTPGNALVGGFSASGVKGNVQLFRAYYTIVGLNGQSTTTRTQGLHVTGPASQSGAEDITGKFRRVEGKIVVGTGGSDPGINQPPVAKANGPYTGVINLPVSFNSTGSTDPDGSIASYSWTFGDGGTGTGAAPTHTYTTAGSYTVQLTVTDDKGATASDQGQVTISGGSTGTPFTLSGSFSQFSPPDSTVILTLSLDLQSDIPETSGPEALGAWTVSSLKWDASVLQFVNIGFPRSTGGTVDASAISAGELKAAGSTINAGAGGGTVQLANIRFKVKSTGGGKSTTTTTVLGTATGAQATGSFDYKSRTKITEATIAIPGGGGGGGGTTVSGAVTSPQRGALPGVTVNITGGLTGTTGSNGSYSIANVPAGSKSVSLANLPSGCTAPAAQTITVASTPVTGVNFAVTCASSTPTGTVNGQINFAAGSQTPSLASVQVTITPGGSGVSPVQVSPNATGAYTSSNVPVGNGSGTVSFSGFPAGCTLQGAATATYSALAAAGTVTASAVTLNCAAAPATGTVAGQIKFATGSSTPSLAAVSVAVTPNGGGSAVTVNPNAAGAYSAANVAVGNGTGTVAISNLPSGCTATGGTSVSYTGLAAGGTVSAPDFTINCASAPAQYVLSSTWGAVTGGQVTLTLKIDMTTLNDPANNGTGPDKVGGVSAGIRYDKTRLTIGSCAGQSGFAGSINTTPSTTYDVAFGLFNSSGASGVVTFMTCTFTVNSSAPPVTTDIVGLGVQDSSTPVGRDITAQVRIENGTLP